jgi:hypothetical protein
MSCLVIKRLEGRGLKFVSPGLSICYAMKLQIAYCHTNERARILTGRIVAVTGGCQ